MSTNILLLIFVFIPPRNFRKLSSFCKIIIIKIGKIWSLIKETIPDWKNPQCWPPPTHWYPRLQEALQQAANFLKDRNSWLFSIAMGLKKNTRWRRCWHLGQSNHIIRVNNASLLRKILAANLKNTSSPDPSVAAACFISSCWWLPSGIFFFGLKVLEERFPNKKLIFLPKLWHNV